MSSRGSFARRLRAEYRKKMVIIAIVCLLIGLAAGFIGGKIGAIAQENAEATEK